MARPTSAKGIRRSPIDVECRDLLRGFRNPESLGYNGLAEGVLRLAGKGSDKSLILSDVISRALQSLEPQDRAIAQRCDIDGAPFADVAQNLGISERHLYRKRKRALQRLAELIVGCSRDVVRIYVDAAGSIYDQIQTSRVLEENGNFATSADILERIISQSHEVQRHAVLLRLAELYARNGRFARAEHYVEAATQIAREIPFGDGMLAADRLVTRAYIFEECGQGEVAVARSAQAAIKLLYAANSYRYDSDAARVLLSALSLCGQSYSSQGQVRELERVCAQASEIFSGIQRPTAEMQVEMLSLHHLKDVRCSRDLASACVRLSRATSIAKGAGLTRSAIALTTDLAGVYRLRKEPSRAIEILVDLLPIARGLNNATVLFALLVELAANYVDLGEYELAQSRLIEAAELDNTNQSLRASMLRTSAKVSLATHQFRQALDDARLSEDRFAAIGKQLLVGVPLRLEAEALFALGQRRAARRAVESSIDVLIGANGLNALSDAYGLLARITGNSKHASSTKSERRMKVD